MAKKAKAVRLTAKRKAFLGIVQKLGKYFDDDGIFKEDEFYVDELADAIMEIFDALPKKIRNINDSAALFGSALYVLQTRADTREADKCSETCKGASPFEAAFFAGWSLGFVAGQEDTP
jgi:hypothetical protein